jgi:Sodium Bile acid symporter family
VSLPIAIGLWLMMWPVLCKVGLATNPLHVSVDVPRWDWPPTPWRAGHLSSPILPSIYLPVCLSTPRSPPSVLFCLSACTKVRYEVLPKLVMARSMTKQLEMSVVLNWVVYLPACTKVRYEVLPKLVMARSMRNQLEVSIVLNWVIGPFLMTGLAWATLPDVAGYRNGERCCSPKRYCNVRTARPRAVHAWLPRVVDRLVGCPPLVHPFFHPSIHSYVCLSTVHPSAIRPAGHPSVCVPVRPSAVRPAGHPSVYLFVHPSAIRLSVYLSVRQPFFRTAIRSSIYLFI